MLASVKYVFETSIAEHSVIKNSAMVIVKTFRKWALCLTKVRLNAPDFTKKELGLPSSDCPDVLHRGSGRLRKK
jgi:hypothetical protein